MSDAFDLIVSLQRRPGLLIPKPVTYERVLVFILGYQTSHGLPGLQEFLELKQGHTSSLHWSSIVRHLSDGVLGQDASDADRSEHLLATLAEFLVLTEPALGLRRLFHEYVVMSQAESWYDPELIRHHSSPVPATYTLPEAASRLGLTFEQRGWSLDGSLAG